MNHEDDFSNDISVTEAEMYYCLDMQAMAHEALAQMSYEKIAEL